MIVFCLGWLANSAYSSVSDDSSLEKPASASFFDYMFNKASGKPAERKSAVSGSNIPKRHRRDYRQQRG